MSENIITKDLLRMLSVKCGAKSQHEEITEKDLRLAREIARHVVSKCAAGPRLDYPNNMPSQDQRVLARISPGFATVVRFEDGQFLDEENCPLKITAFSEINL